jgi:hypothetical protein
MKETRIHILSRISRYDRRGMGINIPHLPGLLREVIRVMLYDAQGVDPDVFVAEEPRDIDRLLECSR